MRRLYQELKTYSESDHYPFHMPGHKRNYSLMQNGLPYQIDITEIDGFDDLHHAEEILKEIQERAAQVFHAEESHYLVNGSTVGLLSAVLGCTKRGGCILMARNCHKSVYNAVFMNELHPVYLYPEFSPKDDLNGEIRPETVRQMLEENPDTEAVVITSPTYDGVVSDVSAIAEIAHEKGVPLIVDEAHGAHFGFHPYFPENANVKGADVVIHSLHKTLPALTQTALLHMNGVLANRAEVRRYLHILQSSSPSYVLMAAIDECIRTVEEKDIFTEYVTLLDHTRDEIRKLRKIRLLETECYDKSKIMISVKGTGMSGLELHTILREKYHLQMEMSAKSYVIAMTSPGDTEEGFRRLTDALREIDRTLEERMVQETEDEKSNYVQIRPEQVYTSFEASQIVRGGKNKTEKVVWEDAAGKIAVENAYLYPPGIPLVVPGERISRETAEQIMEYAALGFSIEGTKEHERIEVLKDGQDILSDGEEFIGEGHCL